MITVLFDINFQWISYFKEKLNKSTELHVCLTDSKKMLIRIKFLWEKIWSNINTIITDFFWDLKHNIKVEIYPEYFFLWAINLNRGIIVLWQPSRSSYFYWWILLHEFIHFIFKNKWLNRMIEEIICFSFERMFIMKYDWIDIEEFDYEKDTDEFHKQAIIYSKKFQKDFIWFYKNKDLIWLVEFLNKNTKDNDKEMKIENNLTNYLLENVN